MPALALLTTLVTNAPDARAQEKTPAPAATTTPSAWFLRGSVGVGGGSVGLTGRLGLQLDYWPSEHVGIGAATGLLGQAELELFESTSESHWFFGPALSVRTSSRPGHAFATATVGYLRGGWNHPAKFLSSDSPDEHLVLRGVGGALGIGWAAGEGRWRPGVLGLVDLMVPAHSVSLRDGTEIDASVTTITLNFTLTVGLD